MKRLSGSLVVAAGIALSACCQNAPALVDAGNSAGGSDGGLTSSCNVVGSCYGGAACPAGSQCDSRTSTCCASGAGTGSGSGGSGGTVTGSCLGGAPCPSGSVCNPSDWRCYASGGGSGTSGTTGGTVTGSCINGAPCPAGSWCNTTNWDCYAGSSSSSGSTSGSTGGVIVGSCAGGQACPPGSVCNPTDLYCYGSGGSSGSTGGGSSSGGMVITGSCFDGGVCPPGSSCTSAFLCEGPFGASSSGGSSGGQPYFWSGSSGGATGGASGSSSGASSGGVVMGECADGGVCPKGAVCDTQSSLCYGTPTNSSSGGWGGWGGSGGGNGGSGNGGSSSSGGTSGSTPTGVGQPCTLSELPGPCMPIGLFCDPATSTCQVPIAGEPCQKSVGCQGQGISCLTTKDGSISICQPACTDSSQCSSLEESCQPSAQFQGSTCQLNPCSNYFGTCNAGGGNDGSCLLPSSPTDLFNCTKPNGCGSCMQGGQAQPFQACDLKRGSNFCQTGDICMTSPSGDGNAMCVPMCSPFNGPTLCPYGYGCYWPIGANVGICVATCPVDVMCVPDVHVATCGDSSQGGVCDWSDPWSYLLCAGQCCITNCPGQSSCQLIPSTPIPACLP